ncbi:hypothetical protein LZ30DRAFT_603457 [Colletotrichum cereale]|nr:hypothetical protein LZ30DRAFT_603457 [Colletotrichum cereale]
MKDFQKSRTYNTRYSLVVTDPTTNPALTGLSMGERTGSRVLQWVWSYVICSSHQKTYIWSQSGGGLYVWRYQAYMFGRVRLVDWLILSFELHSISTLAVIGKDRPVMSSHTRNWPDQACSAP